MSITYNVLLAIGASQPQRDEGSRLAFTGFTQGRSRADRWG